MICINALLLLSLFYRNLEIAENKTICYKLRNFVFYYQLYPKGYFVSLVSKSVAT